MFYGFFVDVDGIWWTLAKFSGVMIMAGVMTKTKTLTTVLPMPCRRSSKVFQPAVHRIGHHRTGRRMADCHG